MNASWCLLISPADASGLCFCDVILDLVLVARTRPTSGPSHDRGWECRDHLRPRTHPLCATEFIKQSCRSGLPVFLNTESKSNVPNISAPKSLLIRKFLRLVPTGVNADGCLLLSIVPHSKLPRQMIANYSCHSLSCCPCLCSFHLTSDSCWLCDLEQADCRALLLTRTFKNEPVHISSSHRVLRRIFLHCSNSQTSITIVNFNIPDHRRCASPGIKDHKHNCTN